jgi:hypothetical protein
MACKSGFIHRLGAVFTAACLGVGSFAAAATDAEAPLSPAFPARQIEAFYMFRSWENSDKLVLIMNVSQGESPADGPEFFAFADDTRYRIGIDNDLDGVADNAVYEFRFNTELRGSVQVRALPWPYTGSPREKNPSLRGITALDGPGSEGLAVRQTYTLTEIRRGQRHELFEDRKLVAVPSNAGPGTMPAYEALAAQGIYTDVSTGIRVFAGQRAQTEYTDAGALYDSVNLRRSPPFLTADEDANDSINPFGINPFKNANVQSIAIEIPISHVTHDGKSAAATRFPLLGAYGSVSLRLGADRDADHGYGWHGEDSEWVQVSRMGNPTFRALVVDNSTKRRWDAAAPEHDGQFQNLLKAPAFSQLLSDVVGLPVPPPPRLELVQIIFKYPNQPLTGTDCGSPCADLLRVNVQVPPTPAQKQHRLGALLSPDPAGLPNGCRPNDDVTDITLRAFGGPAYFAARIGDGVNFLESAPGAGTEDGPGYGTIPGNHLDITSNGIVEEFPFMPTPHDGRDGSTAMSH